MDRAGPSAPKTGDYVCRDALLRSRFLTLSMALGRVQAAAGGSRDPPLAWTLKEPDVLATVRVIHSRIWPPGFNVPHFSRDV